MPSLEPFEKPFWSTGKPIWSMCWNHSDPLQDPLQDSISKILLDAQNPSFEMRGAPQEIMTGKGTRPRTKEPRRWKGFVSHEVMNQSLHEEERKTLHSFPTQNSVGQRALAVMASQNPSSTLNESIRLREIASIIPEKRTPWPPSFAFWPHLTNKRIHSTPR